VEKTKLDLFTTCDYASISQEGKLSVVGMFDQIMVNSIPTAYAQFFIVGVLMGPPNKNETVTLGIKTPNGSDAIAPQKLDLVLGPNGKSNIIMNIGNFPISEVGFYKINLSLNGKKLGEREVGVFKNGENLVPNTSKKYKYTN
jgi:hypothetical protein